MHYEDIFDDMTRILNTDYAGCMDKIDWGKPQFHRDQLKSAILNKTINDMAFENIVNDYLMDYKDGHMFFYTTSNEAPPSHIDFK